MVVVVLLRVEVERSLRREKREKGGWSGDGSIFCLPRNTTCDGSFHLASNEPKGCEGLISYSVLVASVVVEETGCSGSGAPSEPDEDDDDVVRWWRHPLVTAAEVVSLSLPWLPGDSAVDSYWRKGATKTCYHGYRSIKTISGNQKQIKCNVLTLTTTVN